jgi:hypothetical protein
MKLDEVQNCTFAPAVRSKLPEKLKISKERPNLLYGAPETNVKKKVEEYQVGPDDKKSKEYSKTIRLGYFNLAMNRFRDGSPIEAYKLLAKHFDLPQLRKHFNPRDKGPSEGTALYKILHPGRVAKFKDDPSDKIEKMQLNVQPEEDGQKKMVFKDNPNINLLRDVYSLAEIIEAHQRDIEKQIKRIEAANRRAEKKLKRAKSEDSPRAQTGAAVKSVMCPLGDYCPDFLKNRWPVSNKNGIVPLGDECPFAHHAFQVASRAFFKKNEKLKADLVKKLKQELLQPTTGHKRDKGQPKEGQWNPAGNPLAVSARYFNVKDARSDFVLTNTLKNAEFQKRAAKFNERLKSSEQVKSKMEDMREADKNHRLKMGHLNRAKVLFEKRRFKESFETIIKAIAIVKREQQESEKKHEEFKKQLKKKLDLTLEEEPDAGVLLRLQEHLKKPKPSEEDEEAYGGGDDEKDKTLEPFLEKNYQKLVYYAEKTGLIGEKVMDVDQDLRDEIEEL